MSSLLADLLPPMPGRQSIMALESTPSLADCILLVGHVVYELVFKQPTSAHGISNDNWPHEVLAEAFLE